MILSNIDKEIYMNYKVLKTKQIGNKYVFAKVEKLERDESGLTFPTGQTAENFGGFKHARHFNYMAARKLAIQNAVAMLK